MALAYVRHCKIGKAALLIVVESRLLAATLFQRKFLGEKDTFLLCNRGIIVNMSEISAQEEGVFIMKNGTRYPIRVTGQSKIKAAFSQYLIQKLKGSIE